MVRNNAPDPKKLPESCARQKNCQNISGSSNSPLRIAAKLLNAADTLSHV